MRPYLRTGVVRRDPNDRPKQDMARLSPTLQSVHAATLEMLDVRYKNSAVIADTKAAVPLPPQFETFLVEGSFPETGLTFIPSPRAETERLMIEMTTE